MAGSYPEYLREEVERYLRSMTFSSEPLTAGLEEAMRYSLLAGGKRIRPVLSLATARALGIEHEQVLPLAGAIELIHTYSLIHDDLPAMDDDRLRRGLPTCHVKYGEDVAILAGDGLYAEAFHHLLTCQRAPAERLLAAAAELATATGVGGMVGGQYADVNASHLDRQTGRGEAARARGGDGRTELRRVHELKTGRLIGASVLCVLLLTGIDDPAETAPFRRFAAELGVLFQIVDDILDVTGTDDALGKPQGSDERHGKRTYVSEFGVDGARDLARESHRTAMSALAEVDARATHAPHASDAAHAPGAPHASGTAHAPSAPDAPRAIAIATAATATPATAELAATATPAATAELAGIADFIYTRTS